MSKLEELQALEQEMENAELPLKNSNLVFGDGNINSLVMFIGEAPGYHEDVARKPFVGRAGQLLTKVLAEMGWNRQDVYITNIVKRRPPENRDPTPEEIEAYKPYLARQIAIINPRVVVPFGRFSMNYFLPLAKISRDQGKMFESEGRKIYPVFHPAAALRGTGVLNEFRKSLFNLAKILEKEKGDNSTGLQPKPDQSALF